VGGHSENTTWRSTLVLEMLQVKGECCGSSFVESSRKEGRATLVTGGRVCDWTH
jgi:hypothetical protein